MNDTEFQVIVYSTPDGVLPFRKWIDSLKDKSSQSIILRRIERLRLGLFGDAKTLASSNGLQELRINFGPGYRVYFAKVGLKLVLLLGGGDKSSQNADIRKAKIHLLEYRKKHDTHTS
jgi:putative addiction module killer protein